MNYNKIIVDLYHKTVNYKDKGKVANYIPELQKVDPSKFGVHFSSVNGKKIGMGDFNEKFSIQSIAKVLSLALAYNLEGEKLWTRVGVEPSGTSFNSLLQLEKDKGIPRNPLLNAGALVIADVLVSHLKNPKQEFLQFIQKISNNSTITYCERIAESEKTKSYKNAALINLMKSFGNINNDIDVVIDFYFNLCSIEMTCEELSKTFLFLANSGVLPNCNEKIVSKSKSKRINAIMQLCGFYDEAGEFAFKVGLPGKSGVGGGIIAIHPKKYVIAIWSPKLNKKGNSAKGIRFLEKFTTKTGYSIF